MTWARDLCVRSRRRLRVVHVLTDLQRSGLDRGDPVTMPADVDVQVVDLGRGLSPERGGSQRGDVADHDSPRRGGDHLRPASSTVDRCLSMSLVVRLHLECEGVVHDSEKMIELDGGASGTATFDPIPLAEGLWRGHVEIAAGDDLAFDDRRYLAVAGRTPNTRAAGGRRFGSRRDAVLLGNPLPAGGPAAGTRG